MKMKTYTRKISRGEVERKRRKGKENLVDPLGPILRNLKGHLQRRRPKRKPKGCILEREMRIK